MFTLGRQIRQATDFGRNAPGRLAGVDLPTFPDADASFAEAKARIAKSIDFVKGFTPAQIDGTEEKDISWKAGERTMSFKGQAYLLHFCLPHFFFHCTTAYNISAPQRRRARQARLHGFAVAFGRLECRDVRPGLLAFTTRRTDSPAVAGPGSPAVWCPHIRV